MIFPSSLSRTKSSKKENAAFQNRLSVLFPSLHKRKTAAEISAAVLFILYTFYPRLFLTRIHANAAKAKTAGNTAVPLQPPQPFPSEEEPDTPETDDCPSDEAESEESTGGSSEVSFSSLKLCV